MAAPNIVNVATITAKTAGQACGTSATAIISNSAASNKVFKVNTLVVSNVTASAGNITVDVFKNGTTAFRIAFQVSVPANASLVVIGKGEDGIYLEENDSLRLTANATSTLEAVVSYEEIA